MGRKQCLPELRPLSLREEALCQEVVNRGFQDNLNAYLAAGYHPTTKNAIVIACKKIAQPKIQKRLNELAGLKQVKITITSERQTRELDRIKTLAEQYREYDVMVACVKEQNVINGIRIAEQPADSEEAERLSLERKKLLEIGARLYIESKTVDNVKLLTAGENSAVQDEPGLTNDVKSDVITPPEQAQ